MPLGMEVGLSPGDFVLDGDPGRWGPSPFPKRGRAQPPISGACLLWPNGCMDQHATFYGGRPRPRRHSVRWGPSSPPQKGGGTPSPISAYVYCGQTAGWIKMTLDTEVAFGPGHIVLDGDQAPLPQKGGAAPLPNLANDWIDQDATCYGSKPRSTRHCLSWGPSSP